MPTPLWRLAVVGSSGIEEQHQRLAGDQERHTYSQDGGRKLGPPGHQRRLSQGATPRLHLNRGGMTGLAPGQVGFVRPRWLAKRAGGKGSRPPEGVP